MLATCSSVIFGQEGINTNRNQTQVMVRRTKPVNYYVQASPIYPIANQENFEFRQHIVMPGESLRLIARIYSGSEDVTNLLVDNQFLQYRARFNRAGKVVNYQINPGDRLTVRIYGSQSFPIRDTTVIRNSVEPENFTSSPWFWIILAVVFFVVIAVCIIIGFLMNRRNNAVVYTGFMNPAQPLLIPPTTSTVRHIHTHQHNFGKFSPIQIVMSAPAVSLSPATQQEEKKEEKK